MLSLWVAPYFSKLTTVLLDIWKYYMGEIVIFSNIRAYKYKVFKDHGATERKRQYKIVFVKIIIRLTIIIFMI